MHSDILTLAMRQAQCARDLFDGGKFQHHDATITLTNNAHMTILNAKYALKRFPTDVLSFRWDDTCTKKRISGRAPPDTFQQELDALKNAPYLDMDSNTLIMPSTNSNARDSRVPVIAPELGTIFLSVEYCNRIARQRRLHLHDYILLATVHGLAHLVGHVHQDKHSYQAMKRAEIDVLTALRESSHTPSEDQSAGHQRRQHTNLPQSYLP